MASSLFEPELVLTQVCLSFKVLVFKKKSKKKKEKNMFDVSEDLRTNLFFKRRTMMQNQDMTSKHAIKVPKRQVLIAPKKKIKMHSR